MKNRKRNACWISALLLLVTIGVSAQKTISFTFDDGNLNDYPGYTFQEWNAVLLEKLISSLP